MASFEAIVKKFKQIDEELEKIGEDIVSDYPNSKTLVEMVDELIAARTALQALNTQISDALMVAEKDNGLKKELLTKMDESDIYADFSKDERDQLSEFLVQSKQGLADGATLKAYVEKALGQKPTADLIAMIPKARIIDQGKKMDDGSGGFNAYSAGFEAYQKAFDADKGQMVKEVADLWMNKGLDAVAREFYQTALKNAGEDDK